MVKVMKKRRVGFKAAAVIAAVLAAFAAAGCFIAPTVRRSRAISKIDSEVLGEMRSAAAVIAYYAGEELSKLAEAPAVNASYKKLSGMLAGLNDVMGYEKLYIVSRQYPGGDLMYIADGDYRDNGREGTDYFAPATPFPDDRSYRSTRNIIGSMLNGVSTDGYKPELVTVAGSKQAVISCLYISGGFNNGGTVLCIESDPGDTAYHMLGKINLYYLGLGFIVLSLACAGSIAVVREMQPWLERRREKKRAKKENAGQGQAAEADLEREREQEQPDFEQQQNGFRIAFEEAAARRPEFEPESEPEPKPEPAVVVSARDIAPVEPQSAPESAEHINPAAEYHAPAALESGEQRKPGFKLKSLKLPFKLHLDDDVEDPFGEAGDPPMDPPIDNGSHYRSVDDSHLEGR